MRAAIGAALFLAACGGEARVAIDVALELPAKAVLSPYDPSARLVRVHGEVDGAERLDEVAVNLEPGATSFRIEDYPAERAVTIRAQGFDALGNLVAYAEGKLELGEDDASITLPFRRTLAYVTHRAPCGNGCGEGSACTVTTEGAACRVESGACTACPGGQACVETGGGASCQPLFTRNTAAAGTIYVIDLATRALIDEVQVPGTDPRAGGVHARGGEGVMVVWSDGPAGFAGLLSSSDHTWTRTLELPRPQELALAAPGFRYGVAGGGGLVSILDLEENRVLRSESIGGRVLDGVIGAGGERAVLVTSAGIAQLDLTQPESTVPVSPGEVAGASGVGLSGDGTLAYITSSSERQVFELNLIDGGMAPIDPRNGFSALVGAAAFSPRAGGVFAIQAGELGARVYFYDVVAKRPLEQPIVGTLPVPSDIVAGPQGRRVLVISSGTSSASAGLTIIDTDPLIAPEGSTVSYLRDRDDVYREGGVELRQRYQPFKAGALYGH